MKSFVQVIYFLILALPVNIFAQDIFEPPVEIFQGFSSPTVNAFMYFTDFNGDGLIDMGAVPVSGQLSHGYLSVYLNDGGNLFENKDQEVTQNMGIGPYCDCLVDITGDGRSEILFGSGYISNNDIGDDYTLTEYASSHSLRYIRHGYINDDEYLDLLMHNSGSEILYVAYNDGSGAFDEITEITDQYNYGLADPFPIIKDFNNDGLNDIVLYPSFFNQAPFFYTQDEEGNFTFTQLPITKPNMNFNMDAADLDEDGDLEFIYTKGDDHIVIFNEEGVFTTVDTLNSIGGEFYDFDLDGISELLHINYMDDVLAVLSYDTETESYGLGAEAEVISEGNFSRLSIVDLDSDGDLDIILTIISPINFKYIVYWYENNTLATTTENLWSPNQYEVFPNPAQDYFNVQIKSEVFNSAHIRLIDVNGKEVLYQKLNFGDNSIKLSNTIANGLYFYQITDNNTQLLATGKIIKTE